ncbi:MAG: methylated-DNA--[protein]-cysteine S-methyltransferase [Muribaculaceae bacterium]|nr:methylated-DNA--[protein]-cysteine S-methyltransferase [Muribaculaceae bacterium]
MFTAWAGISFNRFLEFLSVGYAKRVVEEENSSRPVAACTTGSSCACGLHAPVVHIDGMTPDECRGGAAGLQLHYVFSQSPFGKLIVASTGKGVCYAAFVDGGREAAIRSLQAAFPLATLQGHPDVHNTCAARIFQLGGTGVDEVRLHLKATPFQVKVWKALAEVPVGHLTTYLQLAHSIGNARASRAVGGAVACNPVALLIPCHRVIHSTGCIGNYHWGPERKAAIIGWEAAHCTSRTTGC